MRKSDSMLSVVVSCYNESENIPDFYKSCAKVLRENKINYELIFIDDGSKDSSWKKILDLHKKHKTVRGIRFSRNFGKEAAITAGLNAAKGDCAVVIDADLQQPPEKIPNMYQLWTEGYDVVEGVKKSRGKESFVHKIFVKTFYGVISKATDIDMSRASDFKLLDRSVIDAVLAFPEKNSFFRAISSWVGFESTSIEYEVRERHAGSSKWSFVDLFKYATTNIVAFTNFPLQLITILGVIVLIFSLALTVKTLIDFFTGVALGGFTTIIILVGFAASALMISLGIIGYYLSKIYEEVKDRPRYIISKTTKERE